MHELIKHPLQSTSALMRRSPIFSVAVLTTGFGLVAVLELLSRAAWLLQLWAMLR